MKKNINRGFVYSFIILTIGLLLVLFFFMDRYQTNKSVYFDSDISELNAEMESTLESYALFSKYIYDTDINVDYVSELMSLAYTGDEDTKDQLREELFDYFEDDYLDFTNFDFRQVHFHFPDSTSFLRMHSPDKYGDSLYDVRYSIRTVNENLEYLSGFEEGRIFNGYRYVYPLSYEGEHVGSVEVSIAMSSVINVLSNIYDRDYCFILREDVVLESVFDDELDNYSESFISENFLIDIGTMNDTHLHNLIEEDELEEFFQTIDEDDLVQMDEMINIGFIHEYEGKGYEVLLNPIENIEGEPVAYFISIQENDDFDSLYSQLSYNILFIIVVYLLVLTIVFLIFRDKDLLQKFSYTDSLTNIDNRRKFKMDYNREIGRLKRSPFDISMIMFDIDYFKRVNDTYGHDGGDFVLSTIASVVKSNIRIEDYFSRIGGEEFIVMLISSNENDSIKKAEEIRKSIESYDFGKIGKVTISLGVLYISDVKLSFEEATKAVDQAMYVAKERGRNCVVNYNDIEDKKSIVIKDK